MSIQCIVIADSRAVLERKLASICEHIELFELTQGRYGISIPTKVVDTFGDVRVYECLAGLQYYDLYAGLNK